MRSRISTLSVLCRRFSAIMRRCDVESFLNIGKIYPEIAPIERRIDIHIDLLRREEFREMECVSDIVKCALLRVHARILWHWHDIRIQAQFEHLAETYFDGFDFDLGERELGYALSLDNDLDMFSASIGLTKTAIETVLSDSGMSPLSDWDVLNANYSFRCFRGIGGLRTGDWPFATVTTPPWPMQRGEIHIKVIHNNFHSYILLISVFF